MVRSQPIASASTLVEEVSRSLVGQTLHTRLVFFDSIHCPAHRFESVSQISKSSSFHPGALVASVDPDTAQLQYDRYG